VFSCDEFRAELSNLIDEEIPGSLRRLLEHHLTECRACGILYDSTRKTLTILTDSGSFELEPQTSERLASRILSALKERP
jgi:predicted anti-sigma-YlaC factor YlaD